MSDVPLIAVVMAGGTGSRLWPLSREHYPKQFLQLSGENTLLQSTLLRLSPLSCETPLVITNEQHRFVVAEQLRQINQLSDNIILEPCGRNTAPAIALSAFTALKRNEQQDPILLVLAADHVRVEFYSYQITVGTPELREAMANFYKRWYNVELDWKTEVLPLIGSKEGILHVTLAFVNPGDEVLVPNPGYPTYTSLSKILGAKIVNYNLREDNGWQPDFDELEKMDLSKVKLMWTNYPNMPTGGRARMETYERLVKFAQDHNIVVVNDNPYSFILSEEHMSIMQVPGAKDCCIEFNSMSKSHNMPGWRVGMCLSNPQFIQWILKVQSNIESGTFRGIQLAAAEALNNNDEAWHREFNIDSYKRRRQWAEKIMDVLGCTYDKNQVGMFLWGKIPADVQNVEDLTERVLHEARVFRVEFYSWNKRVNWAIP